MSSDIKDFTSVIKNFSERYITETRFIIGLLDTTPIEQMAEIILETRRNGGRIFFLGVGGSNSNSSHAVNDFRKIIGVESYNPLENTAELTARTNDDGFETVFTEWLRTSKLNYNDILFFLSVGGGSLEKNISTNLISAINYGIKQGCKSLAIVGRDGGYIGKNADVSVIVEPMIAERITPHTEETQSIILHLLVSHPLLKENQTKWESVNEVNNDKK